MSNPKGKGSSHLPITRAQLVEKQESAAGIVKARLEPSMVPGASDPLFDASKLPSLQTLIEAIGARGKTGVLTESTNLALNAVYDGVCLAYVLVAAYGQQSGMDDMEKLSQAKTLPSDRAAELSVKREICAAVAVYGAARYILWALSKHRADEVQAGKSSKAPTVTINLNNRVAALKQLCWSVALVADSIGPDEVALLRALEEACEQAVTFVVSRATTQNWPDPFASASYLLEGTDFTVDGFHDGGSVSITTVEFEPTRAEDIVGNQDDKRDSVSRAKRVCLFDFERERNPLCDLGPFAWLGLLFGEPGTGKGMHMRFMATLMGDLCARRGVPFNLCPMPDVVNSLQGQSAKDTRAWFKALMNRKAINLGTVDDAEIVFADRGGDNISEGSRLATSTFLTETDGLGTIVRGNTLLELLTNLPGQLDRAVLSRFTYRGELKGARGLHDILDQQALWLKKMAPLFPDDKLDKLVEIGGYTLFSDQALQLVGIPSQRAGGAGPERYAPRQRIVEEALRAARARFTSGNPLELPSIVCAEFQGRDKRLSSRDLTNIQKVVSALLMSFEIPDEWFDKPDLFFAKTYEDRVAMLRGLARDYCHGRSLAELLLDETLRYLDTFAQIGNEEEERQVVQLLKRAKVSEEAQRRLAEKKAA